MAAQLGFAEQPPVGIADPPDRGVLVEAPGVDQFDHLRFVEGAVAFAVFLVEPQRQVGGIVVHGAGSWPIGGRVRGSAQAMQALFMALRQLMSHALHA